LSQYLDDCYEELLSGGATEAEACQQTLAELHGSALMTRELRRSEQFANPELVVLGTNRRTTMLSDLWQDLRFGARMLVKQPGFTLIAVLTLALGIGATTALFSVVHGVLLRPLPYREEARLVTLWQNNLKSGIEREEVAPANFFDWRDRVQSCDIVAAAEPFGFNLSNDGEPETFRGWIVTQGFFEALGATPLHGRAFLPAEYEPGKGQAVVIGDGLWQRRFGGDTKLLGRQLTLNNQPYTVIGIMPPEFQYPPGREVWAPRMPRENDRQVRASTFLRVIGRLKPGRGSAEAQAELTGIAAQLAREYPQTNAGASAVVTPLREDLVGRMKTALLVLFGAVGCLLLIACANVASLQLVRMTERTRELAIRSALGAGGGRLLRQLTAENLLLALLGGLAGVALANGLIRAMPAFSPGDLPHLQQVSLNPAVLSFAAGVSLLTVLLFGLAPAWQLAKPDLAATLKAEGRGVSGGRRRLRNVLVVTELALALVLLTGAGLLARSFIVLLRVNPGFDTERALTLETMIGRGRTPEQRTALVAQMHERLSALPGVRSAAVSSALPFHDNQVTIPSGFQIENRAAPSEQNPLAYVISVTPEYLTTMGIPLLRGRDLTRFDSAESAPVALINQTLAARYWPGEEAVGRKVALTVNGKALSCEIVGIAGDVRPNGYDSAPRPEIYLPYAQSPASLVTWVVRTAGEPAAQVQAVKEKIREANPAQSFLSIATLDQLAERTIRQRRFNLLLLGAFALLALTLAGVGLYGVLSAGTAQRTQEIGLRMALGAQARDVLRLVIGSGLKLALYGLALGFVAALALTRLMTSLLFEVRPTDPLTYVLVATLLLGVALLACWLPARKAAHVDPLVALRAE
ncbi:MAG TPA: ABC transporter permease, partial [Blastocatellia bacterium]|nr:ABC transporter permease [Blastocatellia bacterium]